MVIVWFLNVCASVFECMVATPRLFFLQLPITFHSLVRGSLSFQLLGWFGRGLQANSLFVIAGAVATQLVSVSFLSFPMSLSSQSHLKIHKFNHFSSFPKIFPTLVILLRIKCKLNVCLQNCAPPRLHLSKLTKLSFSLLFLGF